MKRTVGITLNFGRNMSERIVSSFMDEIEKSSQGPVKHLEGFRPDPAGNAKEQWMISQT